MKLDENKNYLKLVFGDKKVRVTVINGVPWFVAQDVCDVMDIKNARIAVQGRKRIKKDGTIYWSGGLDNDEKLMLPVTTSGQRRNMLSINEFGIYKLSFKSHKQEAKTFTRWVTHEVLPTIRRNGAYMTDEVVQRILQDSNYGKKLALDIKYDKDRIQSLETAKKNLQQFNQDKKKIIGELNQQITDNIPKVEFYNTILNSKECISIEELAKLISKPKNKIIIGRNRLYKWMREKGYLMINIKNRSVPTQKSIDLGVMDLTESANKGNPYKYRPYYSRIYTLVTPYGQVYFTQKIKEAFKNGELHNSKTGERLINRRQAIRYLFSSESPKRVVGPKN